MTSKYTRQQFSAGCSPNDRLCSHSVKTFKDKCTDPISSVRCFRQPNHIHILNRLLAFGHLFNHRTLYLWAILNVLSLSVSFNVLSFNQNCHLRL